MNPRTKLICKKRAKKLIKNDWALNLDSKNIARLYFRSSDEAKNFYTNNEEGC
jgi:hypothetical protein